MQPPLPRCNRQNHAALVLLVFLFSSLGLHAQWCSHDPNCQHAQTPEPPRCVDLAARLSVCLCVYVHDAHFLDVKKKQYPMPAQTTREQFRSSRSPISFEKPSQCGPIESPTCSPTATHAHDDTLSLDTQVTTGLSPPALLPLDSTKQGVPVPAT